MVWYVNLPKGMLLCPVISHSYLFVFKCPEGLHAYLVSLFPDQRVCFKEHSGVDRAVMCLSSSYLVGEISYVLTHLCVFNQTVTFTSVKRFQSVQNPEYTKTSKERNTMKQGEG